MRRIDHVVIAVHELDETAALYRRLGFQVGPRNRHPWGTENRLIQFGSSFIELISMGTDTHLIPPHQPRKFSFGAFVQDYLREREGIAMLVLSSEDARFDAAMFADHGIGDFEPFSFSRESKSPDGTETQVSFTLAFATDAAAPELGFFVCQQHYPENFWNKSFQQHANGARNVSVVTMTSPEPERHRTFLTEFGCNTPRSIPAGGLRCDLDGGCIEVLSGRMGNQSNPSVMLTSLSVQVNDLKITRDILTLKGIDSINLDDGIVVSADFLHGVELRLTSDA
jgi:catechol 2,3-dioxygenase-like lactoylglutathione lyase family enzyme